MRFLALVGALLIVSSSLFGAKVVFVQDNLAYIWKRAQVEQLKDEFSKHKNIEFSVVDSQGDVAKQALNIKEATKSGAEYIIVSPVDQKAIVPALKEAQAKGVEIVFAIRSAMIDDYLSYIHPDDREIARKAAAYLAKKLKGEGRVVMIQGVVTSNTVKNRREGFLEVMDNYPDIEVVIKDGNYLRSKAILITENMLRDGEKFDAIYAHNDAMVQGVIAALKKNEIEPSSLYIVGVDYTPEAIEAIKSGYQSASFTYPTCALEIVDVISKAIDNKPIAKDIVVPSTMVDRTNVDEVKSVF